MLRQRIIASEQPLSLAKELQAHNIRHGDVVHDVVMQGVGFSTAKDPTGSFLIFAFCPMRILSTGDVFPATRAKRQLQFPTDILWTRDAMQTLRQATPYTRGFVNFKCTVASNGAIHLSNVHVFRIKGVPLNFPVNQPGTYDIFRCRYPAQTC